MRRRRRQNMNQGPDPWFIYLFRDRDPASMLLLSDADRLLYAERRIERQRKSCYALTDPDLEPVGLSLLETIQCDSRRISAVNDFRLGIFHIFIVCIEQHIAVSVGGLFIGDRHFSGLHILHILKAVVWRRYITLE